MGLGISFRIGLAIDRLRALVSVPLDCTGAGISQAQRNRVSPRDALHFTVGGRPALLCYGRPAARNRSVFGELVPYGELWRLGANEPTVLHLPFGARIAGVPVAKGKLSLYAIPTPTRWTIVLNRSTRQWGLTRAERGRDGNLYPNAYTEVVSRAEIARVDVDTRLIPYVEQFTARAVPRGERRTDLEFEWETVGVSLPIEV